VISENGKNFVAEVFKELCKLCGIKRVNSSFYHPPGNGLVERTIKSMKQILTMYVDGAHSNWDSFLQPAILAYNTSEHASIGYTPYEVLFASKTPHSS
jgi:transposase InsO family protein